MRKYGQRDAYSNAIDKIRSEHKTEVKPALVAMECPKCGNKQMVPDVPGQRRCERCGHEFGPLVKKPEHRPGRYPV